jgi:caa(3)-type oxidase subunit IV
MTARALILTYLALMALAAASWLLASAGTGIAIALLIAVVKTLAIALVFMELWHGHASDRMIAITALFFVVLLCAGALADVSLR